MGEIFSNHLQVRTLPKRRTLVYFLLENIRLEDTEASVIGPNDRYVDAKIHEVEDSVYQIEFEPLVVGVHTLSIFHRGEHVPGELHFCIFYLTCEH